MKCCIISSPNAKSKAAGIHHSLVVMSHISHSPVLSIPSQSSPLHPPPTAMSPKSVSILRQLPRTIVRLPRTTPVASITHRAFTTTPHPLAKDPKMPSGPPKHEMVHFPAMTTALPSESGEFRRVLWTGLYSQVVLMTVPVGGDIGDEVGTAFATGVQFGFFFGARGDGWMDGYMEG